LKRKGLRFGDQTAMYIVMNNTRMTKAEVMAITPEQVYAAYSGKPGCACGCKGTYRYNPTMVEFASKNRGYEVTADEVNFNQIKKALKVVQSNFKETDEEEPKGQCSISGNFASVTLQTGYDSYRVYTVYVKK
jgi:hypothetical protein